MTNALRGTSRTRSSGSYGWVTLLVVVGLLAVSQPVQAHDVAEEMAEAAQGFLKVLTPEQRATAVYELKSPERLDWHFIPRERKGLPLKALTPAQRHLAYGLLSSGLSHRGFFKATAIMSLEQILRDVEKGSGPVRDPELYYFTIFGEPTARGTWGWRVEGHHLSLNFTLVKGVVSATTPAMMGSNPGEVRAGPQKGLRVLGREEDLGRALVKSLDESQRRQALLPGSAPADIILGPGRKAEPLTPMGLRVADLNPEQRGVLKELLHEYVLRHRAEVAGQTLKEIAAAGPEKLWFAWMGGLEKGDSHYYRVQGPTFILEYDNTQNNANHVHTTWRDLKNDFGEDTLRRHYEEMPHPH